MIKKYVVRLSLAVALCSVVQAVDTSIKFDDNIVAHEIKDFSKASVRMFNVLGHNKKQAVWRAYMQRKKHFGLAFFLVLCGGGHCFYVNGSYIHGLLTMLAEVGAIFFTYHVYDKKGWVNLVSTMNLTELKKSIKRANLNHLLYRLDSDEDKRQARETLMEYYLLGNKALVCVFVCIILVCFLVAWFKLPRIIKQENEKIFEECLTEHKLKG